jgi:hypothetical protein
VSLLNVAGPACWAAEHVQFVILPAVRRRLHGKVFIGFHFRGIAGSEPDRMIQINDRRDASQDNPWRVCSMISASLS